ncbi:MAG: RecQ family ATP-dependent DNA helicase [Acidimicrobiia bacterium]|nr:RecQ family ATP-dependent DNA helicase [Acidimicrobiia bacterium]MYC57237.1 RecQ family ATP-dependent DNA helicase [Acidimicrobiia bacterium]MYI30687.1 RecQ family ATP-dependent DNA helicase [Acidimicrobiia bacterium]
MLVVPQTAPEADSGAQHSLAGLSRCVAVDLEVSSKTERIHSFAGVRCDTGESFVYPSAGRRLYQALAELDALSDGADFVLGHNFIEFDMRHLQAADPDLRLLQMPVVDTLWLNPLAFPHNPYHHLVKHYQEGQLITGRKNDPEQDALIALEVFVEQQKSLLKAPSDLLAAWHWLTTIGQHGSGFDLVFRNVRGSPRPSNGEARAAILSRVDDVCCRTHAHQAVDSAGEHGWSFAYALAWLWVAGGNSVMPPWVRHQFPDAGKLVRRLRDRRCDDQGCSWCQQRHNAHRELKRLFGFDNFRPQPTTRDGHSLQQAIVEAAMGGDHVLGILPTGTGKSLCYQIPALSRYEKTGAVTVVISPLVALMADQVAGLESRGISSCVTINSLLSMPERTEALEKLRLGDAAIVLISPEQLRSISFRRTLDQREIGAWVLDEVHCLSKWGHDFRPDYRYIGRYIRERAEGDVVPPVLCLTATAKPEVKEEITEYFAESLSIKMRVFDGGSRRTNLEFQVVETTSAAKDNDICMILAEHLPTGQDGGAIVYCATRRRTEEVANFLNERGFSADRFHAGLQPEEKKAIQRSFIDGELRAIVATNAFGMGIDKPDVRLVIHADIPSSLENYLQEAGRAGRDQQQAHCMLLYTRDDVERQFAMSARSRLTRREIHGVLKALRRLSKRNKSNQVETTVGEILLKDDENAFRRDSATDDTRGRTALAWLEEADLLSREENRVRVFPSSLRVSSVEEANKKLEARDIDDVVRERLLAIVRLLINANPDEGISTDLLMDTAGLNSDQVRGALYDLERCGVAVNDTALTAFVHVGVANNVANNSKQRLKNAVEAEAELLNLMQEMAPDMGIGDQAPLNLRVASQRIKDAGHAHVRPEYMVRILQGIAADGRGEGIGGGSITVRKHNVDTVRVTLKREWHSIVGIAQRRRDGAARLLDHLLSCVPKNKRGTDILVKTTLGKLNEAVEGDLSLASQDIKDFRRLADRSLLWLHEQEVIRLNKGLTVFRPAMSIHLTSEQRGYWQSDFQSLQVHYDETVRQIHVMAEYAQRGLANTSDARRLTNDYFTLGETKFLRRWLPGRSLELARQTTPESWRDIVASLKNSSQRHLVTDNRENTNVLVLAGPGSGKTKVLVHRIAYLIRVKREDPRGILALAYNRHAAVEIRRRLAQLVGDDARRVLVLTCHAMAMRLVGASFSQRVDQPKSEQFQEILEQATALLRGDGQEPEEVEETRARLLAGFRWILVDEYQDIAQEEYDLISALAGRNQSDEDSKPTLFAVGDDDQNIYAFKGSSVRFIRSFEKDYGAKPAFLIDNYRSTRHIIEASNAVIKPAKDRMKVNREIRINKQRAKDGAGGLWVKRDPVGRGRVQVLPAGQNAIIQAQTAMAELQRLRALASDWDWASCAVLAREWQYLEPVRSICELEDIPVQMANEDLPSVWHLRETQSLLKWLRNRPARLVRNADLRQWHASQAHTPWMEFLQEAIKVYGEETCEADIPVDSFIEWLAEWGREARRCQQGLLLSTAHRAKGLEFDHVIVLDGGWERIGQEEDPDAARRLYYVSMTRARHTLALGCMMGKPNPFQAALKDSPNVHWREPTALSPPALELQRRYRQLNLKDVYLSFAGREPSHHRVHAAIAALSPNDPLQVRQRVDRWELLDQSGVVVGVLARSFEPLAGMVCTRASVLAIATWGRQHSEPQYQQQLKCDTWEVVVPELIFELS